MRPADQAHDAALGAAIRTNIDDFYQHAIAVHGRTHSGRRDENISRQARLEAFVERAGFGDHKAETITMHAQTADRHILAAAAWGMA